MFRKRVKNSRRLLAGSGISFGRVITTKRVREAVDLEVMMKDLIKKRNIMMRIGVFGIR